MPMLTKDDITKKVQDRQKMVTFLNDCVPALRKLAQSLKLTRKADGTLNKRDNDKLKACLASYASRAGHAYIQAYKTSLMLVCRVGDINKNVVIYDTLSRYDDLTKYKAYTAEEIITALERKEKIKQEIRALESESTHIVIDYDLNAKDLK